LVGYFEQTVREYMSTPPRSVPEDVLLPEVQAELDRQGISAVTVVDASGRVTGVISRSDLLEAGVVRKSGRWQRPRFDLPGEPVQRRMTRNPLSVSSGASVARAVELLLHERVHRVLVHEGEELVGVFSVRDALCAVADDRVPTPIAQLMTSGVAAVRAVEPVERALERLESAQLHALVVTEGELPIGLFGQPQALAAMRSTTPSRVEDWFDPGLLCLSHELPAHRAAAQALALGTDPVVVLDHGRLAGVLSASDLARAGLPPDRQEALRPRGSLR
jgi:tRNA nucleotidyltransferase (CCA-adding enzyme)